MTEANLFQPYEVIVTKFLPTFRARLAQILTQDFQMTQTEIARHLGISQAAISHYKTGCRGGDEVLLDQFPEIDTYVHRVAKAIAAGAPRPKVIGMLLEFSRELMTTERFCEYHKRLAPLEGCTICFEPYSNQGLAKPQFTQ